jgi:sugar phosphate isomerase/epimerase
MTGGVYADPKAVRGLLDANGLKMTCGHFSIDMLEGESAKVLDIAGTLGMKAIYCPHIVAEKRPTDAAGWVRFGERLQKAGESVVKAGYVYGWHNHDFEFKKLPDGSIPQQRIFEGGPALKWEADIAWLIRGGADPIEWIEKFADRTTSVHIKDIAPAGENTNEDGWADVGHGTVDWKGIWKALKKTPATTFVMEHDKPSDHKRFASRSIAAARKL